MCGGWRELRLPISAARACLGAEMDSALPNGSGQQGKVGYPEQTQALSLGKDEQTLGAERTTILSPHKPSPDDSEINDTKKVLRIQC